MSHALADIHHNAHDSRLWSIVLRAKEKIGKVIYFDANYTIRTAIADMKPSTESSNLEMYRIALHKISGQPNAPKSWRVCGDIGGLNYIVLVCGKCEEMTSHLFINCDYNRWLWIFFLDRMGQELHIMMGTTLKALANSLKKPHVEGFIGWHCRLLCGICGKRGTGTTRNKYSLRLMS